jgi:hypothetical protein
MIVPMLAAAPAEGEFAYQLPANCLSAYRLVAGAADAAIVLPYDPNVPQIEPIREQLKKIAADPKSFAIDLPWYALAGVYEGPSYCKGSPQYDLINGLFAQALAARTASAQPDAPTGVIPRNWNPLTFTRDQLFGALGIPTWLPTALIATAAVGVGAWAYVTFLQPVTRAAHHQNPRRRRAR